MKGKKAHRRRNMSITVDELEWKNAPTLEDILAFVNGGKYQKFFLKRPKVYPDGSVEEFTTSGARAYRKLVAVLYAAEIVAANWCRKSDEEREDGLFWSSEATYKHSTFEAEEA